MPTDDNSIISPGSYTVYVRTQAEPLGRLDDGFTYTEPLGRLDDGFTYTEPARPQISITSVSPSEITIGTGGSVIINGEGFDNMTGSPFIDFNRNGAEDYDEECYAMNSNNTTINCLAPSGTGKQVGTYPLVILDNRGNLIEYNIAYVTVSSVQVRVDTVSPSSVCSSAAGSSREFAFTGQNLNYVGRVNLMTNDSGADDNFVDNVCTVTSASSTTLTCRVSSLEVSPYEGQYFDGWFYDSSGNFLLRKGNGFIKIDDNC